MTLKGLHILSLVVLTMVLPAGGLSAQAESATMVYALAEELRTYM